MKDLLELLKDLLPVEIAVISAVFIYFLLLFKNIAKEFISIAEKQTSLAEKQTQYIQQRLDIVEKTLGISDKAFDLQEKRIKILEDIGVKREIEISQSQNALNQAREDLRKMENFYLDAINHLSLTENKVEEIKTAHRRLQKANRVEAIASFGHSLKTQLQIALTYADNLKSELPELSRNEVEKILESIEDISLTIDNFADKEHSYDK